MPITGPNVSSCTEDQRRAGVEFEVLTIMTSIAEVQRGQYSIRDACKCGLQWFTSTSTCGATNAEPLQWRSVEADRLESIRKRTAGRRGTGPLGLGPLRPQQLGRKSDMSV